MEALHSISVLFLLKSSVSVVQPAIRGQLEVLQFCFAAIFFFFYLLPHHVAVHADISQAHTKLLYFIQHETYTLKLKTML